MHIFGEACPVWKTDFFTDTFADQSMIFSPRLSHPWVSSHRDLLGFLVLSPASPQSDRTGGNTWVKENKSNHGPAETNDLPVVKFRAASRHTGYLCLLWPERIHYSTQDDELHVCISNIIRWSVRYSEGEKTVLFSKWSPKLQIPGVGKAHLGSLLLHSGF